MIAPDNVQPNAPAASPARVQMAAQPAQSPMDRIAAENAELRKQIAALAEAIRKLQEAHGK